MQTKNNEWNVSKCLIVAISSLFFFAGIYQTGNNDYHSHYHDPRYVRKESVTARRIFELQSYRDGQLFHFDVPLDTRKAIWTFRTNFTMGCRPGLVTV